MEKSITERLTEQGFEITCIPEYKYNGVDYRITIVKENVAACAIYGSGDSPTRFLNDLIHRWYRERRKFPNYSIYNATGSGIAYGSSTYMPYDPIKKVIFNPPATIVFWTDGSKTVVKAQNNDLFDYEKGLTMAIAKKAFGNKGNYFEQIKKWTKDQPGIIDCTTAEVIMHDCAEHAYQRLLNALHDKKATKADLGMAMEEAVGYLGQILDD